MQNDDEAEIGRASPAPSEERRALWQTSCQTTLRLWNALDAELQRDAGIPIRYYEVLARLECEPEGVQMNEVARELALSQSGLTRVVDRMEKEGFVQRLRPEHDRRTILLVTTQKGVETTEQARAVHFGGIERHFAQYLTENEVRVLRSAFGKMRDAVGA